MITFIDHNEYNRLQAVNEKHEAIYMSLGELSKLRKTAANTAKEAKLQNELTNNPSVRLYTQGEFANLILSVFKYNYTDYKAFIEYASTSPEDFVRYHDGIEYAFTSTEVNLINRDICGYLVNHTPQEFLAWLQALINKYTRKIIANVKNNHPSPTDKALAFVVTYAQTLLDDSASDIYVLNETITEEN
jgi:hypothetical protein